MNVEYRDFRFIYLDVGSVYGILLSEVGINSHISYIINKKKALTQLLKGVLLGILLSLKAKSFPGSPRNAVVNWPKKALKWP